MLGEQTTPGGAGHGLKGSRDGGQCSRVGLWQGQEEEDASISPWEVSGPCPAQAGWAAAPLCLPGAKPWRRTAPSPSCSWLGWAHTPGQMAGLSLGTGKSLVWQRQQIWHTSAQAEFPEETSVPLPWLGSRRMACYPLWLGPNTQCPSDLHLGTVLLVFFLLYLILLLFLAF